MSRPRIEANDKMATLLDSCVRVRINIAVELLQQLADNAEYQLKHLALGQTGQVDVFLQASTDKTKTIKPSLTFEETPGGAVGVVTLVVETHQ